MLHLPDDIDSLRDRFADEDYVPLPGLLPPEELAALRVEVRRLESLSTRRDFAMECMEDSPRHMTTLGGQTIAEESGLIPRIYHHPDLLDLLRRISTIPADLVRDPLERHVINILHRDGDTHGAHTDDYPLALVLFTEAPHSRDGGGLLQYAPGNARLRALDDGGTRLAHHRPGDAYLLRSDTTAHRVTPLRRPGLRRVVVNFAYTTPDRQRAVTSSASQLY